MARLMLIILVFISFSGVQAKPAVDQSKYKKTLVWSQEGAYWNVEGFDLSFKFRSLSSKTDPKPQAKAVPKSEVKLIPRRGSKKAPLGTPTPDELTSTAEEQLKEIESKISEE